MRIRRVHTTLGVSTALALAVLGTMLIHPSTGRAHDHDDDNDDESKIHRGFAMAPVPLNLAHKNRALVGLGSYLVNAAGSCNDCYTNPSYLADGDPFQGKTKKVNTAGYMGGGQQFGPFTSRIITPDRTGKPEGGHTFSEFLQIMRTGIDFDDAHP